MRMRCGWIFNKRFAGSLLENLAVKKIENRLRIGRVTAMSLVSPFFGTRCSSYTYAVIHKNMSQKVYASGFRITVCKRF